MNKNYSISPILSQKIAKKNASKYGLLTWMILSFGSKYLFSNLLMLVAVFLAFLAFKISFPLLIMVSFLLQLLAILIFIFYLANSKTMSAGIFADTDDPAMIAGAILWLLGCIFFEMIMLGFMLDMSGLLLWGMILFVFWLVLLSI